MSAAPKIERLCVRPEEAAEMIGFKRAKFFQMLRSGEIKSFKCGASRLIEVDELKRWIEEKKKGSGRA